MKYINIRKQYILFVFVTIILSACSHDDLSTTGLKVFINSEIYPTNQFKIDAIRTPVSVETSEVIKFPIKLTYPSPVDMVVHMAVDNSLVDSYNTNNGTSYKALPEGAVICTGSISIKANEMISTDSVALESIDLSKAEENSYLIPIKIAELVSSNKGAQISENLSTVYITAKVTITNINISVLTNTGDVYDKESWSASALTEKEEKYAASKMIDGDNSTAWICANKSVDESILTIDMSKNQSMAGIRITPNFAYSGALYAIKQVEVYTSDDNSNWTKQGVSGVFSKTIGNATTPNYKIIQFYTPVSARYFQLRLIQNWSTLYTGIGEIDVIKQ